MTDLKTVQGDPLAAEGTPFRRIRMPDDMWEHFRVAVARGEPELDRSKVLREFIRWYVGETNDLPRRPDEAPKRRGRSA
jgi:hypothetical protein